MQFRNVAKIAFVISCKWFNQHEKYIEQNPKEPTMITPTIQLFPNSNIL